MERCRVLEEGGCASVCLNVCKVPTQNFFSDLGLDVELRPDYETFECRFVYGKKPPPAGEDPAFDTPCFAQCSISKSRGGAGATDATLPRWAVDGIDGVDGVGARGRARTAAPPTAAGCPSSRGTRGGTTAAGRGDAIER